MADDPQETHGCSHASGKKAAAVASGCGLGRLLINLSFVIGALAVIASVAVSHHERSALERPAANVATRTTGEGEPVQELWSRETLAALPACSLIKFKRSSVLGGGGLCILGMGLRGVGWDERAGIRRFIYWLIAYFGIIIFLFGAFSWIAPEFAANDWISRGAALFVFVSGAQEATAEGANDYWRYMLIFGEYGMSTVLFVGFMDWLVPGIIDGWLIQVSILMLVLEATLKDAGWIVETEVISKRVTCWFLGFGGIYILLLGLAERFVPGFIFEAGVSSALLLVVIIVPRSWLTCLLVVTFMVYVGTR